MSTPIAHGDGDEKIPSADVLVVFAEGLHALTIGAELDAVQHTVFETEGRLLVDLEAKAESLASSQTGSHVSAVHLVAHTDVDGRPTFGGRAPSAGELASLTKQTGAALLFLCGENTAASATKVHAALGALSHQATVIGMPQWVPDFDAKQQLFVRAFYERLGKNSTINEALASFTKAYDDIFDSTEG